jgi:ribose 5-phosphate isomerase A
MSNGPDPALLAKVAARALAELGDATRVGLGTGKAAEAFIQALARDERAARLSCVPTSEKSDALARSLGLRVVTLADVPALDVAFDGADEVDGSCALTKGLGGAMLRERVVASEAARFIVLVTEEKLVARLGSRSPLPVEVTPFALATATRRLERLAPRVERRQAKTGGDFVSDNNNAILDVYAGDGGWADAQALDHAVRAVPGVVDTGFFFGMTSLVIVAGASEVRVLTPT